MSEQQDPHDFDVAHTGPVKNPKQLLQMVLFAFVVPVFVIIGLVYYVTTGNKPSGMAALTQQEQMAALEKGVTSRIQKVGRVEVRDANRTLKTGEEVFKVQCFACHTVPSTGAPQLSDAAAWAPRIATGLEALVTSATKGKGAMAPQLGDLDPLELQRAVVYLANAGGAKFDEPKAPAAAASAAGDAAAAPAAGASAP